MIPLRDDNPTVSFPIVTISLIVLNIIIFFYEISLGPQFAPFLNTYGAKPLHIMSMSSPPGYPSPHFTIFSSMFLHGGFFHVAGNMLYLWIFGNNIEDSMGHFELGRLATKSARLLIGKEKTDWVPYPDPMVGASGA